MEINPFDRLHHKILVSKSQGGDVSEYEAELNNSLDIGLKEKDPLAIDFINRLNTSKPLILKPSFLDKHSKSIIKVCETPYKIMKWFMILSVFVMVGVEVLYA